MSQLQIQQYLNNLSDLKKVSGTNRESVVREAFKDLLKGYGREHDLVFVPEYEVTTIAKERRYVDGALLHALRVPFGFWEAKDEKDDLDAEIAYKLKRGYPQDNIIFEDSTEAVLIQHREEVMRCPVEDVRSLQKLLGLFFQYERPEVANFRKAVDQFKIDLPQVLASLRRMIEEAQKAEKRFAKASTKFLRHARHAINPSLTEADVREMLIQHILTEEIFSKVFGEDDFHRQNNVAKALYELEGTFFTGDLKKRTLRGLDPYYAAIRSAAAQISSHHEKQTFLKLIYENFYKVYNPKAADRLGVIYTPNDIVRFMIEGADWLCEKHFGRNLIDPRVEILDPATGTGTFISELLEHFRGQPKKLKHKYLDELHANEVGILPYYVANLNIEATYAAIMGEYQEFPNLCFVDTLDNVAGLRKYAGHQPDLFGSMSEENVERIKRQNNRKISVVIGNPPYNANQLNENENNKNRAYLDVDKRIKETYIAASEAQKTKLYDMYARFFRWASDRVDENGIIAFVSNNSFVDARTFDGFRAELAREFNEVRIVDLKGNARTSGERRRREGGNIFNDQIRVGVAIWFAVKKKGQVGCRISYEAVADYLKAEEKHAFLAKPLKDHVLTPVEADADHNWLNEAANDFASLVPLASKDAKVGRRGAKGRAIFRIFSLGYVTARDDWMTDFDPGALERKVRRFCEVFTSEQRRWLSAGQPKDVGSFVSREIKWTSELEVHLTRGTNFSFDASNLIDVIQRPFVRKKLYFAAGLTHRRYQLRKLFSPDAENELIFFSDKGSRAPFGALATRYIAEYHLAASSDGFQAVGLYEYTEDGERIDNVTDWALTQFKKQYPAERGRKRRQITKESIFRYVYAVLHDPVYRETYALNLKRGTPRIPFYPDFWCWSEWGKALISLHAQYESVARAPLTRTDRIDEAARNAGMQPKPLLKGEREVGRILVDTETILAGIPPEAWEYRLGNQSALDWVLEQYKERKPRDPTVREHFNTYRFSDHKEEVIDLLLRVVTVSVETVRITEAMRKAPRST